VCRPEAGLRVKHDDMLLPPLSLLLAQAPPHGSCSDGTIHLH
jgi:hypothetical protein